MLNTAYRPPENLIIKRILFGPIESCRKRRKKFIFNLINKLIICGKLIFS
jgi:hypothetical protein